MPTQNPHPEYSRVLLEQLADKWTILVLSALCHGPARFNDIKRTTKGVSQRSLTQCLRRLERNGLVRRKVRTASPISVEYSVTTLGQTLFAPFEALRLWTEKHEPAVLKAQAAFDAKQTSRMS